MASLKRLNSVGIRFIISNYSEYLVPGNVASGVRFQVSDFRIWRTQIARYLTPDT